MEEVLGGSTTDTPVMDTKTEQVIKKDASPVDSLMANILNGEVDKNIVKYVVEARASAMTDQETWKELIKVGWQKDKILAAFSQIDRLKK